MDTRGFQQRIQDLDSLKGAILHYAPRKPNGDLGRPYRGWIKTLDKEIALARRWTPTDKPPPESPLTTSDAHGLPRPTSDPTNGHTPSEKPSESHPRAWFPSPQAPTDAAQLQDPQPPDQMLPLLCRILYLKEFPAG